MEKGVVRAQEASEMMQMIDTKLGRFKVKNPEVKREGINDKIFRSSILAQFIEYPSSKEENKKLFEGVSKKEHIVSHEQYLIKRDHPVTKVFYVLKGRFTELLKDQDTVHYDYQQG
jgi:hypothetical protein